jgi:hypothetical protein
MYTRSTLRLHVSYSERVPLVSVIKPAASIRSRIPNFGMNKFPDDGNKAEKFTETLDFGSELIDIVA